MEKIWLREYFSDVPDEIGPISTTLGDMFDASVNQFSELPAYSHLGHELSYRQLAKYVNYFAAYLQHNLNVSKGDRMAIMMPNCFAGIISLFAALKIGAVVVNINPLYTSNELLDVLQDATPTVIILMDIFTSQLSSIQQKLSIKHTIVASMGDIFPWFKSKVIKTVVRLKHKSKPVAIDGAVQFANALKTGAKSRFNSVKVATDDLAFLQYTGGTTGKPKAAMLTHENMMANISQTLAWFSGVVEKGKEVNVLALPVYHIFSLTVNCFVFLAIGGLNIIITNPRDLPSLIKQIANRKITFFVGVNTLFHKLLRHPKFETIDFDKLKITVGGGMAVHKAVAREWEKATKIPILEGYGQTEASPIITVNRAQGYRFSGSIGLPLPSTNIKIIDEDGNELPVGKAGELCVKAPQVMQGYWNNPETTAEVLDNNGWLATGDIGYIDEKGSVYLCERKKDIIIVSGFNVYPNEIEAVLTQHPSVEEAAVIGMEDTESGERIQAFIVPKDSALTDKELDQWCHKSLAQYKCPKHFVFRKELPKTNIGKVLRRKLRE